MKSPFLRAAAPWALLALAGCAALPPDGGLAGVDALTQPRVKQPLAAARDEAGRRELVRSRLSRPLSAEDAVAIAVVNNPRVQLALAEVGVAEADLVQAGRLRNPGFSYGRFRQGHEREIERRIVLDVLGLVTMPLRVEMERAGVEAARGRAAIDVVRVADEARRAWIEAVAAAEMLRYAGQVKDAAEAGAELASRMLQAGNYSKLSQSREQLFFADAITQHARARQAAEGARERLARVLALEGGDLAFALPAHLPEPPAAARELHDAEAAALAQRLDVQGARREAEAVARSLGLERVTRFVNVLHLGYERSSSNEEPRRTGYEVELELPLFDWGEARHARAEAIYRQALARTAEAAIRARSEVRESHSAYRTAHAVARHYRDEIVPLRKRISEENLLRYNGMLIGVFELLADARAQVAAVMGSIEATRDFWIADANLETALLTGSPQPSAATRSSAPAAAAGGGH